LTILGLTEGGEVDHGGSQSSKHGVTAMADPDNAEGR
jgi:hypothetical protein